MKIKKRAAPQPPNESDLKHAYKLYLSKEFTLQQITRSTKVSAYWIYKHHKKKLSEAAKLQTTLFND
jgi:hypothetical protein